MELSSVLLPTVGGFMMGAAALLLFLMLGSGGAMDRRARTQANAATLVGFAFGVPLGAYLVSSFVRRGPIPLSVPSVLIGALAGGSLTLLMWKQLR